jgi:hypothetical protein
MGSPLTDIERPHDADKSSLTVFSYKSSRSNGLDCFCNRCKIIRYVPLILSRFERNLLLEFLVVLCNNSLVMPRSSSFECASDSKEDAVGSESGVPFLQRSLFTDVQKFVKFNGSGSSSSGKFSFFSHGHERIFSIDQRSTASG